MVVRDRLKELQEKSKYYKDGQVDDIEMKPLNSKDKLDMQSFFQSAEEIALGLSEIKSNVEKMKGLQRRILYEPSRVERDKFQAEHSDLIDINKSLGGKIQRLVKNEIEANNKLENKSLNTHEMSELRLRKTQIATQASRYLEIWAEYSTMQVRSWFGCCRRQEGKVVFFLQVEFREKAKESLAKNIRITNNSLTTEEIEDKIDKGVSSVQSLTDPLLFAVLRGCQCLQFCNPPGDDGSQGTTQGHREQTCGLPQTGGFH